MRIMEDPVRNAVQPKIQGRFSMSDVLQSSRWRLGKKNGGVT